MVSNNKNYKPRYYPTSIQKKLLTRKAAIWRSLKFNESNADLNQKYIDIANKCRLAITNYDLEREKQFGRNNIGAFYKFANKKLKKNSVHHLELQLLSINNIILIQLYNV